jgi:hypothetical protein
MLDIGRMDIQVVDVGSKARKDTHTAGEDTRRAYAVHAAGVVVGLESAFVEIEKHPSYPMVWVSLLLLKSRY